MCKSPVAPVRDLEMFRLQFRTLTPGQGSVSTSSAALGSPDSVFQEDDMDVGSGGGGRTGPIRFLSKRGERQKHIFT